MPESSVWRIPLTPLTFLERSAQVFPDRTAIVHGETRQTYAEFSSAAGRLAAALRKWGIQKGDRVAFLCPNTPYLLAAHFGVPLAGAVLVAINTRLNSDEIAYILNHSGSRMLFVDAELASLIKPVRSKLETVEVVVNIVDVPGGERQDGLDYDDFTAVEPCSLRSEVEDEDGVISINYTSGTTGFSKGVMYTHRGAYLNALAQVAQMQLDANSVYLWTLPMFHCNGWCYSWAVIAAGAASVCLRKIEPGIIWDVVQEQAVTHLCGAPTVLISLANYPGVGGVKLSRKLNMVTGGAPPSPTMIEQMGNLGAEITHMYGLTETYGPNTVCQWQSQWDGLSLTARARLKARQGVRHINAGPVRVVDGEMRDVPPDAETMGEVVMRGNTVMKGYFADPEATAQAFRGGWLHSGDLGVMHPDGYIELRDRQKDVIISGGENVSTIEVERVIAEHPEVLEAAVIAMPDSRWGEVPKAFVALKAGATVTEQGMIAFCRDRLAHFKCPKAVEFGELPKTSTGKIQKFLLREKEWAGRDKRIQ